MTVAVRAFTTVFRRELATVARTPGYVALGIGTFVVFAGITAVGGGGATGIVPAVVDLLLPVEVIVPLIAVVLGYRALLADAASGELAVIRTYPVGTMAYVLGVVFARAAALVALIGVPLALVGGYVWLTASPDTGIYATHPGVDSPALYARFVAFVLVFGFAYLTVATAVSSLASSRRTALALAALVVLGGVLGGDLAVLRSLSAEGTAATLSGAIASTPNGAFRGLVLEHVVGVAFAADGGFVDTGRALLTLLGWTVGGVVVAAVSLAYGRVIDAVMERLRRRLPS